MSGAPRAQGRHVWGLGEATCRFGVRLGCSGQTRGEPVVRELLAPAWDQGGWGRVVGIGCPIWRQMQLSEERQGWWKGLWQV